MTPRATTLFLLLLSAGSCNTDPILRPPIGPPPPPQLVPQSVRGRVDLLFMLDTSNGPSDAMNAELKNRFPHFLEPLHRLAAAGQPVDLHIGVVTSDYGAGATGAPGCSPSPGGQQGRLIAL